MTEPGESQRLSDEQLAQFIALAGQEGAVLSMGSAAPDAQTVPTAGPEARAPAPGETWGKFLIEKTLGRGGQAVVCQAFDRLGPAGHVAFKVPRRVVPPAHVESWIAGEAGALARLDHPNIVRVVDAGAVDGVPFVATRLIEGLPLSDHARRARPACRQMLDWMIQLADALDYAHTHGVVHRDLKPGNIVITQDARPLIIDFGIASLVGPYEPAQAPGTSGTPAFMAPEQAAPDAQTDHRVDVFALGGVLKFLLDGAGPYGPEKVSREAVRDAKVQPPDSRIGRPLRRALARIATRALQTDPARRYANAAEMAAALRRVRLWRRLPAAGALAAVVLVAVAAAVVFGPGRPRPVEFDYQVVALRAAESGPAEQVLVTEGSALHSGEQYRVRFQPREDCFLYLFTYDAAGRVYALFPHRQIRTPNRVPAGSTAVLPGEADPWFTLDDNAGRETLILVASRDPLPDPNAVAERMQLAAEGQRQRGTVLAPRKGLDAPGLQAVLHAAESDSRAVKHLSFDHLPAGRR